MVNKWTVLIKSIQTSSQVRWKHLGLFFVFAIDLPCSSGCWQGNLYQFHDENRNLPQVVSYRLSDFQGWHFYVVLQRTSQLKLKFWFLLYFSIIHEQPNKSSWMGPKIAYYIASVLSLTSLSVNREVMFTSIKIICCLKPSLHACLLFTSNLINNGVNCMSSFSAIFEYTNLLKM